MRIDVFHDTACPWCRIGKAHLKQTLADYPEPVEVHYHTFFLNESIPPEGAEFREYMLAKGGGQVPLEQFFDGPRRAGARAGITFNFEQIEHAPNTLASHRLIAMTPEDQREAMIDAVYAAYFEHGRNIGDLDVLAAIAADVGLDRDGIRARLGTDEAAAEVITEARQAQRNGISGVPFFIFNNRLALSGAQPPQTMRRAMNQAEGITE